MATASPTQRTLIRCKRRGWDAGVVERYNYYTKRSNDLLGFIDIVALDEKDGCLGIQATSGANGAARVHKIINTCGKAALNWLARKNRIEVWSWKKYKVKRGGKAVRWQCNRYVIFLNESGELESKRDDDNE
jgi:hypothetical protein